MAYEQRDNTGSIFINKGTEEYPLTEKSPTMTGKAMVGGTLYYVSAWAKKRENGEGWLSFAYKPVKKPEDQRPAVEAEDVNQDLGGLPF